MIKHVTEVSGPEDHENYMIQLSATYAQSADNYSDTDNENILTIHTEQGGYYIIETSRWAFSNVEEMIKILMDFHKRIEYYENKKS